MFLGLPDPDPSINKQNSKKNPYFYFFVTSIWLLSMKTDVNDLQKVLSQKTLRKNFFFVGILSATDEIPSGLWNKESGSRSREANPGPEHLKNKRLRKSVNVIWSIFCYLA